MTVQLLCLQERRNNQNECYYPSTINQYLCLNSSHLWLVNLIEYDQGKKDYNDFYESDKKMYICMDGKRTDIAMVQVQSKNFDKTRKKWLHT